MLHDPGARLHSEVIKSSLLKLEQEIEIGYDIVDAEVLDSAY